MRPNLPIAGTSGVVALGLGGRCFGGGGFGSRLAPLVRPRPSASVCGSASASVAASAAGSSAAGSSAAGASTGGAQVGASPVSAATTAARAAL